MSCVLDEIVVVKRSGQRVNFDGTKIAIAIKKAFDQVYDSYDQKKVNKVYLAVLDKICNEYQNRKTIQVEDIQDIIEEVLINQKFKEVYAEFNTYRLKRSASRDAFSLKQQHKFVKAIEKVDFAIENNQKMTPLDLMHKFGSVMSQEFAKSYLIDSKYVRAHDEGNIYIPSLEVYALGVTSSACLNLSELEKNSLEQFTDDILKTIYQVKQEQYGEQIISHLNLLYKPVIIKDFLQRYQSNLTKTLTINGMLEYMDMNALDNLSEMNTIGLNLETFDDLIKNDRIKTVFEDIYNATLDEFKEVLKRQIRRLLLKLNGFDYQTNSNKVSITLNDSNEIEQSLFIKNYLSLLDELEPLANINTIYKLNGNTTEETYSLLSKLISDKKNIRFYSEEDSFYLSNGISLSIGQPLLSTITINLPRLALKNSKEGFKNFLQDLEEVMELSKNELMQRFEFQASKYKETYKYLFENNLLLETKKLDENQKVRKVLKNGVLSIDYVGLCDTVCILKNKEHFDIEDVDMAFKIIEFMNNILKQYTEEYRIKFVLSENRNKQVRTHLLAIDKSVFVELSNKKDYISFSNAISNLKLDKEKEVEIYSKMQSLTSFKANIKVSNNVKKINSCLQEISKTSLKYYQIQVGNNDN